MEIKRYKDFIKESKEEKHLWTYEGSFKVDSSMILNGKFIKGQIPDIIEGSFNGSSLGLTSLEGGPVKVGGNFGCSSNRLKSLVGGPDVIGGYFDCSRNKLTSLEGGPIEIKDFYDCSNNQLTSLEGVPKEIKKHLYCYNNKLKNLEHVPKKIGAIQSDFEREQFFINSGSYKNNYWEDLLRYMIKNDKSLEEIKGWPEGFLTKDIIKSAKGLSKFNL